jgi:16S rRNA (guanine527-N7)-methyltransferase
MVTLAIRSELIAELPAEVREQLRTYRDLILHWNQRFNLTALEEPELVDRRLVGDALRLLPAIDQIMARPDARNHVIDLGTGAGLPGLVLKIARPDLDVTMLDATHKKVRFVQHVITELGLERARAIHGRAEDLGQMLEYRHQFDIGTARGVAALPTLLELLLPLLQTGGSFLLPKGDDITVELAAGKRAANTLGGHINSADLLPGLSDEPVTRLVSGVKIRSSPDRYPRRAGIPNREPLGREG